MKRVTRLDTGVIVRSKVMSKGTGIIDEVDVPYMVTSVELNELANQVVELQRQMNRLVARVEWIGKQEPVKSVWIVSKDK